MDCPILLVFCSGFTRAGLIGQACVGRSVLTYPVVVCTLDNLMNGVDLDRMKGVSAYRVSCLFVETIGGMPMITDHCVLAD